MTPSRKIAGHAGALRHSVTAAALFLAFGVTFPARADTTADSERANLLFRKGKVAYNTGKPADALRIYTEAWSLKKSPDIAANLALAEADMGKHRDAAEHFSFALAHLLPSSTDEQKAALSEGLAREKKEIGALQITLEPAAAALSIDEQAVIVPANGEVFVEPGERQLSVTLEGYEPKAQQVQVSKGAAQVLWFKLEPVAPKTPPATATATTAVTATAVTPSPNDQPPTPSVEGRRPLAPALIGGGLVVAGAAVGVVFLLSGNAAQSDANALSKNLPGSNACGGNTPNAPDCAALHQKNVDVDHARTIEVVGFTVAGAAAVGTALYLLWPHSSSPSTSHFAPTFSVAPGLGSLGLSGRF